MKIKAIKLLDEVYSKVSSVVKSNDDYETINLIQPILDEIDDIQNDIKTSLWFQNVAMRYHGVM